MRAFPTFKFYIDGNVMEEVRGANPQLLESTISRLRPEVASFSGSGNTLGGGGAPADARAAFLSRFEQAGEGDNSRDEDMEGSGEPSGAPPVVNQELLSQMKELGFPEVSSQCSLPLLIPAQSSSCGNTEPLCESLVCIWKRDVRGSH